MYTASVQRCKREIKQVVHACSKKLSSQRRLDLGRGASGISCELQNKVISKQKNQKMARTR
jgi:hypothetical protein